MTFRVGQKVVCVDATRYGPNSSMLREGAVYTIASVDGHEDFHGEYGVLLVEVTPTPAQGWREGFRASRFRPIVERKTDISFAHEILRKATKPARSPSHALHNR